MLPPITGATSAAKANSAAPVVTSFADNEHAYVGLDRHTTTSNLPGMLCSLRISVSVGLLLGYGAFCISACDSAPETTLGATGGSPGVGGATNGDTGGSATDGGSSNSAATGGSTSAPITLPALHVDGAKLKDPSGKAIVLRGVSLIDIGSLYYNSSQNARGITTRIDKVLAAGLKPHVIRLPVYPRTVPNGNYPAYSTAPFPLGPSAPASNTQVALTMDDYLAKVLKPAVDYVTQKGMYAIIDYHQIDDTDDAVRTSAADANTFWQYMAAKFKDSPNVIYEAYNEPMDSKQSWSALKPRVQKLIDTIRASAPDNLIIVPSQLWCQRPGDAASDPPTGTNLMYTAHVYPGNWASTFKTQVTTATAIAPVFFTEWGYSSTGTDTNLVAPSATWGTDFKTEVNSDGGSWTAWVTDNSWQPAMFSDTGISKLTDFGTLAKDWLAETYTSDWVE
jgi:hypothetical protein